ncbi:MAG: DUF4160 domain-containing protein [Gammaproteobacteria bacterium]
MDTGEILDGEMPRRAKGLIIEWWAQHRVEPAEDWRLAEARRPLKKFAPLE